MDFFRNSNWFLKLGHFFKTGCHYMFISTVGIIYISWEIRVLFETRGFQKNTFPIGRVIISLGNYISIIQILVL